MSDFLKKLRERSQANASSSPVNPTPPVDSTKSDAPVPTADVPGPRRFAWQRPSVPTASEGPEAASQSEDNTIAAERASSTELAVSAPVETVGSESEVSGPVGFKAKLDAFDGLIGHVAQIDPVLHGIVKARVKDLMIDLQSSPEMRELLIDRDVHNIMKFVQSSTNVADKHFEQVATKRIKKENSKGAAANAGAALDKLLLDFGIPSKGPVSLDSLSNLNTDNLPTKLNK